MKTNFKMISMAFAMAYVITSCETDKTSAVPQEEQQAKEEKVWETTDSKIIEEINSEIEKKVQSSKASVTTYRNFRIYTDAYTPSDIVSYAKSEIDQMYVSGLKSATIGRMDDINGIYLAATSSRGMYYNNGWVVINDYNMYRSVKKATVSVVLHELVHFYHDRYIVNGFNNSTVNNYFLSARSKAIYPLSAYVLSNRVEYLGTSGEAYFSGTSRPPYNRSYLKQQDPNLGNFIATNF